MRGVGARPIHERPARPQIEMGDLHPSTKVVPRALVLQIVEGGEVDVHHATLIWDAQLPSGKIQQFHSPIDAIIHPGEQPLFRYAVRKLLIKAMREVIRLEGFNDPTPPKPKLPG